MWSGCGSSNPDPLKMALKYAKYRCAWLLYYLFWHSYMQARKGARMVGLGGPNLPTQGPSALSHIGPKGALYPGFDNGRELGKRTALA